MAIDTVPLQPEEQLALLEDTQEGPAAIEASARELAATIEKCLPVENRFWILTGLPQDEIEAAFGEVYNAHHHLHRLLRCPPDRPSVLHPGLWWRKLLRAVSVVTGVSNLVADFYGWKETLSGQSDIHFPESPPVITETLLRQLRASAEGISELIRPWAAELRKRVAKEITAPEAGQVKRLGFDPETRTVTLDGTSFPITDPKAYALYAAIAEARPLPLTKAELRTRVRGCNGTKTIRNLLATLPGALRDTVLPGSVSGYCLKLKTHRAKKRRT